MNVFDKIKQSFIKEQPNNIERAKQAIKTRNEEMELAKKELVELIEKEHEELISDKEMKKVNIKEPEIVNTQTEGRYKPAYENLDGSEAIDMQLEDKYHTRIEDYEPIDMQPKDYFEEHGKINKQTENNFKSEMKEFGEIFAEFKKVYSEYEKINSKLQKTFSKLEKSYSNLLDKTFSYNLESIEENTVPSFRNKGIDEIKKANRKAGEFMSSTQLSKGNTVPSFRNKGIDEIKKANRKAGEFMSSTQLNKENTVPLFRNKEIEQIQKVNREAEKENSISREINQIKNTNQETEKSILQNNSSEIYLKQKKVEEFNKKAIINGSKERAELLENGEIAIKEMKAEPLNTKEEKTTKAWTR
jgi:hypothetical protein